MSSQAQLVNLEKELSYLFWRAQVHRFSAEEIQGSVDALRARMLGAREEGRHEERRGEEIDRVLQRYGKTLSGLVARAAHFPPSGLVGADTSPCNPAP